MLTFVKEPAGNSFVQPHINRDSSDKMKAEDPKISEIKTEEEVKTN